jgi:RES domain-containing protein
MHLVPDTRLNSLTQAEALLAYRFIFRRHAASPLPYPYPVSSTSNRWNAFGTPMIYCAGSLSLAIVEMQRTVVRQSGYLQFVYFTLAVPAPLVEILPDENYPPDWNSDPQPSSTQKMGSDWQQSNRSLALLVRSARCTEEYNVLINPLHPEYHNLKASAVMPHPLSFLDPDPS